MKKIVIAASLVAAIGLGAFAKNKFFAQTDGSYLVGTTCITVDFGSAKLEPLASGKTPLKFTNRDNTASYQVYLGGTCNTSAPAQLIP